MTIVKLIDSNEDKEAQEFENQTVEIKTYGKAVDVKGAAFKKQKKNFSGITLSEAIMLAEKFFRENFDLLLRRAEFLLKNSPNVPLEPQDILSESWEVLIRAIMGYDIRKNKNLSAYLKYKTNFIFRDVIRDFSGKEYVILNSAIPLDENLADPEDEFNFTFNIDHLELLTDREKIFNFIAKALADKSCKAIMELYFVEKKPLVQISKELNISYYKLRKKLDNIKEVIFNKFHYRFPNS